MTWDEINKKRLPYIRMGDRLFKGMYNEIKKQLKIVIQDWNTPEQITEAVRKFSFDSDIVKSAYLRFHVRTGIHFARDMQKGASKRLELKDNTEDVWLSIMKDYVEVNTATKISQVISTSYKDIENVARKAVDVGIENGWGMDKIARKIVKDQGSIDKWKAMRIARTEVVAASNKGVLIGADELVGNKKKVWISSFRPTARPDHLDMDGERVNYHDDFVTPKGNRMEFPGDPACGDASDIINCTCGYEVIVEPEIY